MSMASADRKPNVAVVASPGLGHVIPLLEFSKRLVTNHGCHVTFLEITTTNPSSPAQEQLLQSQTLPLELHVVSLPPVHVEDILPDDPLILTSISLITKESLTNSLKAALLELNPLPKAVVVDMFCTDAFDICKELSVPVFLFFTSTAALLTFSLYLPGLDQEIEEGEFVDLPDSIQVPSCSPQQPVDLPEQFCVLGRVVEGEFINLPKPIQVPDCGPLQPEDLVHVVKNRKHDQYKWYLLHATRWRKAAGIFINTWEDLESVSLSDLRENPFFLQTPSVYVIGPLIKPTEGAQALTPSAAECLIWLDMQPPESVLFICFGSGGTLTTEQLTELAWGLELSQQRFVWVIRAPTDLTASGNYFNAGGHEVDPNIYLPKGFLERTNGTGLVVPSWALQSAVLQHSSTGAFLSHCGWNSTLESISCGVPMIAWPLYAEQGMNAAMLEEVGVAVWPGKGVTVVDREQVMSTVMDGEEGICLKRKARELKESAAKALACGGTSMETLTRVSMDWK